MNDASASRLLKLSAGVFFMGGFAASIIGLLVPRLRLHLELNYLSATLIQLASHSSYLVLALPIAAIIGRQGYMRSHTIGLGLMSAGFAGVIVGTIEASFSIIFAALCAVSAGATFLQIASNTVVTVVGNRRQAAFRLNVLQGLNSIGTVLGPLLGAPAVLSVAAIRPNVPMLSLPFGLAALVLMILAALFWYHRHLLDGTVSAETTSRSSCWRRSWSGPQLRYGALAIFVYVGAEVTIGTLLVDYLTLPRILGIGVVTAGQLVSLYWGGAMIGRFAGAGILRTVSAPQLLLIAACGATILVMVSVLGYGSVGAMALIGVGLFNSIMYPTIYVLALPKVPDEATCGATILCMAVVGGAIIPVLTGALADMTGLVPALLVPGLCYVVVAAFARVCRDQSSSIQCRDTP